LFQAQVWEKLFDQLQTENDVISIEITKTHLDDKLDKQFVKIHKAVWDHFEGVVEGNTGLPAPLSLHELQEFSKFLYTGKMQEVDCKVIFKYFVYVHMVSKICAMYTHSYLVEL
jgi:hypothetical protein